tara:strand:- start:2607 stop:2759 length:153 start_codon:yes stop_codon:yes gene_type:complete
MLRDYTPFTSNELTDEEKRKLFAEFEEQKRKEEEEMKRRLKLHKPRGEAY